MSNKIKEDIRIHALNSIIKAKIAHKAIHHVINKVEQFNGQYFPLKIKIVGIGGSCLRNENPKDVDIFIEACGVREKWKEWQEFKECLNSNIYQLYNLQRFDLHRGEERTTINKIIENEKDRLLVLGFENTWIENWFPWVRISDIKWGVDRGLQIAMFSEEELISRFINDGWNGKKLEIHVKYFDPEGNMISIDTDVPSVTIWMAENGVVIPSKEDLDNFLQDEHNKLIKLSKNIIEILDAKENKFVDNVPEIYNQTIFMIKDNENERFINLKNELRKLAFSETDSIKKIIGNDNELSETNTRLRNHLKHFALIGLIYLKITNIGYHDIITILKAEDVCISLCEILSKRLKGYGYWKRDIAELLKAIDLKVLAQDVKVLEAGD